ncbi:MAG: VacB/RNase II family 3'-5' exoribonuclease [Simkaniaceae bacterium]|nr:VacB/RNase II family 3'-5' exoribonuclease [Simkaniaceae bacterium]
MTTVIGTFSLHPRGFGFVVPNDTSSGYNEIFIPKRETLNAINGDTVEVEIAKNYDRSRGPDGRVVDILERGRQELTGIVEDKESRNHYYVHVPSIGLTREIVCKSKTRLDTGDHVTMRVEDWGKSEDDVILTSLLEKFGNISDPSLDVKAAVREFEIRNSFPKKVSAEAKKFGDKVTAADKKGRHDLTKLETFTIDPTTAKDFDDALSIQKTKQGFTLHVHIADVSHYVRKGTALDDEATTRFNSTYFPGTCIPMLPPTLSDNLCSLKEKVDRLAVTVEMEFRNDGHLENYDIYRSVINSNKRFTYEEAMEVLEGKRKSKHIKSLEHMVELCLELKRLRIGRGSVDLGLPEVVLLVDKKGMPYDFAITDYDITHQLVEEFMLKANEVVATHLTEQGKSVIYRVHEEPANDKIAAFTLLARQLGFRIPDEPSQQDIQHVFEQASGSDAAYRLAIGFVKSMKLAIYSDQNVGHYGLSLEHYTHFTSPIRRYCDLVVHRLLFENEQIPDMGKIASLCSESERKSFKAESHVKVLKKLRLLDLYFDEDPDRIYEATVSEVKPFGVSFEVSGLHLDGFIHVSKMRRDYFVYNQETRTLRGERTGLTYSTGKPLKVCLESIDLVFKETEWSLA